MRSVWRHTKGQALVEVLIAIALTGILLPTLAGALVTSRAARAGSQQQLQATAFLDEANEAVRSVREEGWSQLAVNGTYHPEISGTGWNLVAGSETVSGLTRQIVVSDTRRDAAGAIISSGGTIDASTKQVVATVSWTTPITNSLSSTTYFQRWQNNAAWTQTTQANFSGGTPTNTAATSTAGGEVQLAAGSPNWNAPTQTGLYNLSGNISGLDVFVSGNYAYVGYATGMAIIDVSNPASPTLTGTYTTSAAVNGVYVSGDYAYLATANSLAQLVVVNIANKAAPTLAASRLIGDATAASTVAVADGYVYVGKRRATASAELFVVDISNPLLPSVLGGYETNTDVNSVEVAGNYAYLATGGTTRQLTIVNISNKLTPSLTGFYSTPAGTPAGGEVDVIGTTAYLGTANNASGPEFYAINVATPASPTLLGSYEFGGAITSVSVSGGYAALGSSLTAKQFTVLNVTAATPTLRSNYNFGSTINDVVVIGNYAYAGTANTTKEFVTIGGGGSTYQGSGTLESSTFDAGATAAYNYLTFSGTIPANTALQFQLATNNDNATWNYVGPNGTAATYYTVASAIPYNTLGRYVRYKATLSGNGSVTPILQDVTVNYSP